MLDNKLYSFDPVLISDADNQFLLDHLGEPTIVALRNIPPGVLVAAVRPILERVNELQALATHESLQWVGVDKMKEAIRIWFRENKKWAHEHKTRNAPRWPSMYSFDQRGRPHRSGPGSDSGRVRTWIGPDGKRVLFALNLIADDIGEWTAPEYAEKSEESLLNIDHVAHRIECRIPVGDEGKICGYTETYRIDSRASFNAARARMSKHLRRATENVEAHRELHTNEFGS